MWVIRKSYGGVISVESKPELGTTFRVLIPANNTTVPDNFLTEEPISSGHERILLVDDEASLAELMHNMLEPFGYRVTIKTSSYQALEALQEQPDNFDLVITDQTMPEMTGAELAQRMLQIRPNLPIILCTGYSSIMNEEKAKEVGIKAFILKPFEIKDITKLIRKTLEGE